MNEKELWDKYGELQKSGIFSVGPHFSYQFLNSPRHVLFSLSRYKYALKLIEKGKKILELGCSDGLGTYYLSEFADMVMGIDFDEESIKWAKENLKSEKILFKCDNFLGEKYGSFDAVVSFDVIEHICPRNEEEYMMTVVKNLKDNGIFIIGTPNVEFRGYAKKELDGSHVNMYSGDKLLNTLGKYFNNVFLFTQNDEIIHTGFFPSANYLIGLCCYKKM